MSLTNNIETPDDDLVDLDALLADSISHAQDSKKLAEGKKKLSSTWLSTSDKAQLQREVAAVETRREWTSVAVAGMFHTQRCSFCSCTHTHFQGLFVEQVHNRLNSERWVKAGGEVAHKGLNYKSKFTEERVDRCINCHTAQGDLL